MLRRYSTEEMFQLLQQADTSPLAEPTVRRYRATILEKFEVTTLAELLERLGGWFTNPLQAG